MVSYISSSTTKKIEQYATTHEEFTLAEVLDFQWDVAYHDVASYMSGQRLKSTYQLDFEIEPLETAHIKRLLFFKEGELVRVLKYQISDLYLSATVERILPSDIFLSSWEENTLILTLVN